MKEKKESLTISQNEPTLEHDEKDKMDEEGEN